MHKLVTCITVMHLVASVNAVAGCYCLSQRVNRHRAELGLLVCSTEELQTSRAAHLATNKRRGRVLLCIIWGCETVNN